MRRSYRTTTALVASAALVMPPVAPAFAQDTTREQIAADCEAQFNAPPAQLDCYVNALAAAGVEPTEADLDMRRFTGAAEGRAAGAGDALEEALDLDQPAPEEATATGQTTGGAQADILPDDSDGEVATQIGVTAGADSEVTESVTEDLPDTSAEDLIEDETVAEELVEDDLLEEEIAEEIEESDGDASGGVIDPATSLIENEVQDGAEALQESLAEESAPEPRPEPEPEVAEEPAADPEATIAVEAAPDAEVDLDADVAIDADTDMAPAADAEATADAEAETAPMAPEAGADAPVVVADEPVATPVEPEAPETAEIAPAPQPADDVIPESAIAAEIAAQPEPELTEEQVEAREAVEAALGALETRDEQGATPAAAAATATAATDETPMEGARVEEQVLTEEDVRTSDEDFQTQAVVTAPAAQEDSGLSNAEKFALGALGVLAVGTILNNRARVVSNSGDRVVVQRDDGDLQVLKDDDALLRQAGANVRTETFDDGSTRTIVTREDGSRVVTVRDASLRVLRRTLIQPDGSEVLLIDDTAEVEPVDVATLPDAPLVVPSTREGDDALRAALAREAGVERRFSLAQVRNIAQVRALAPAFEVDTVTFPTGSAAIQPEQAENLTGLAREVLTAIRENPREVFLVEGHTDAVGDAAYNLALSDRRAESLALALNEYFGVPVENMVVQGYGERFLKVPTQGPERANRRATVRQITDLLRTAAAN